MLAQKLEKRLNQHAEQALRRERVVITQRDKAWVEINSQLCVNFCSNDYLCLTQHAEIKAALVEAIAQYGIGSGASASVAGYFKPQQKLEKRFAEFMNCDRALFFNSGYHANLGVISALANRSSVIVSDKLCHASLLDGIHLSRAKHHRYQHTNITHLTELITANRADFIVTESVFSMEGDIAPLSEITRLAQSNKSALIVDDAHGIGVLGRHGGGICEHLELNQNQVTCLSAPLGKAFGCAGAIVAGGKQVIETVLQFARSYRYTTALPPAIAAASIKSLEIVKNESWRREKLQELIQYFIRLAKEKGLPLVSDAATPIKCLLIGDNARTQIIQQQLLKKGFFVSCIRPPTVPVGTARIRLSLSCFHTKSQIEDLINHLSAWL